MGVLNGRIYTVLTFIVIALALLSVLPRLCTFAFPSIPQPSETYDCDDGTLDMYRHFEELGIESTPMVGNLDMTGEAYMESNHVWLMVRAGDREIAYDWGFPRFDRQHYEGYPISLEYLMHAVEQDRVGTDTLASAD